VIEDQIDSMAQEFEGRLRQFGIEDLESYLQTAGQTLEEYREGLRVQATAIAERNLIISEVLRVERLEVTDEDVEAHIETIMGDADREDESAAGLIEMFRDGAGRPMIETQILQQKGIDRLVAIARGEEIPLPADDEDDDSNDDDDGDTPQADAGTGDEDESSDAEQDAEDENSSA
jgi:trigger factor